MSELVADCPRCGASRITFDVLAGIVLGTAYNWQQHYEAFGVCRHCSRSTVFKVSDRDVGVSDLINRKGIGGFDGSLSNVVNVDGFVSQKDADPVDPPDHLPDEIAAAFNEGAKCLTVGCYNAAAAMFRLCIDHATRGLLPTEDRDGLNSKTRRSLGLRMQWLFKQGLLPAALEELSTCVREDGNDGAHVGSLTAEESEDLLDFSTALLERLFTEPERLKAATLRRDKRRGKPA